MKCQNQWRQSVNIQGYLLLQFRIGIKIWGEFQDYSKEFEGKKNKLIIELQNDFGLKGP